jgi:hypothetical protein
MIAADRKIDWAAIAGVTGGIPTRLTICSTMTSSNTLAQINKCRHGFDRS